MEDIYLDLFDCSNVFSAKEPGEVNPKVTCPDDYPRLYYRVKNTLCGIGQNPAKRLLRKKQKEGDEIAGLYRAVLDAESSYSYYCMYLGTMRYEDRYYNKYYRCVVKLVRLCLNYNLQHLNAPISIGYKPWACLAMECLLFIELPGMQPVSFYAFMELVENGNIPLYEKEWDGIVNGNYKKIEEAVQRRYADYIKQKRNTIHSRRVKMSCVSAGNLLTPYRDVSQPLQLITMQDTTGRTVTMNDVYQIYQSYTMTPTYVIPHGMYVIHIQDKTWSGKLYESVLRYLHHELRTRDWYVWASLSAVDNRIDVIAYIPPIFFTEVEAKANIAVIYSKVMLAIVDFLNIGCDYIFKRHIISVDHANSIWDASYSAIMLNGAFCPGPLLLYEQFNSDEDYYGCVCSSGLVNPNYKLCFFPPDSTEITSHDDDIDIAKWIEERARGL
jgi:hypothetical protein